MPNPTPKPIQLVKGHRTKAEIKLREKGEKELLTGVPIKETQATKENETAHKEFLRLKKLLKQINHDDDLYSGPINTYCQLKAEIQNLLSIDPILYDRQIMDKRKMMLAIEKENIMTIQSALRSVPKKPEPKKSSPMADYLARQKGG